MTTPDQTPPAGEATTGIAEYSVTTAALAEIRQRMKDVVYDLKTTRGLDDAKRDRRELVTLRTSLEAERKRIKAPALAHCALIDAEAKRITAEIVAVEEPIDQQIKAEEARREEIKRAKEDADRRRIATIQSEIDIYRRAVAECTGMTSEQIAARRQEIMVTRDTPGWATRFDEFADEAKAARDSALIALADLQDRVAKQEADDRQREADRRELEELRRAQAEAQARAEREAAERAAQEARERAEREAEEARQREAREDEERRAREAREAAERAQREAAERAAAEARRIEDERLAAERARLQAEREAFERQQAEAFAEAQRRHQQYEAEARAAAEAERKAREERERAERERVAQVEAAARAQRHHLLANTTLTGPLLDLLSRCEAFVAKYGNQFAPPEAAELLGDLRAAIHSDQPARVAA